MSLLWYVNRLRSMPPGEVAHRVNEGLKRNAARGRLEGWDRYRVPTGSVPSLPGLRPSLLDGCSSDARRAIEEASKAILAGEFAALGVRWPTRSPDSLFPATIWRLDPVTEGLWPGQDRYCFDIGYRHERTLGDVKYVWEFNRLQFLQPLAAHVALTHDAAALAAIEQALASWYGANPPFRGIAWVSGIELALRSISLLVTASLCGDVLSTDTVQRVRTMLNAHAFWLQRYPSRFSSANNHLVAEAAAELLIGIALPDLPRAGALERTGRRVLEKEAAKQLFADGVPAEQSPTYGAFTAEFLLLSSVVAQRAGKPLADIVQDRLVAFAGFVTWLSDAKGMVPRFGDDDEGRVLTTSAHESRYVTSVSACIAAQSGTLALGQPVVDQDLRTTLFGATGAPAPPAEGVRTFARGGYSVIREHRAQHSTILVFDHGPLGYLSIAAHGHADALAFTLTIDDRAVLVDAGTYLYHAGGAWRDWFRGTRAHNTVALGEADQSTISGPFNWSHKAQARLDSSDPGPLWRLTASHDGYMARFGVRHERTIAAQPHGYAIIDRLVGALPRERSSTCFLVAPDCDASLTAGAVRVTADGRPVLTIHADAGTFTVERGAERDGWYSPSFGLKVPTCAIRWTSEAPLACVTFALTLP